jgi:aryl-alcohol dehydrogenase-like predicted oxidoreductase
MFHRERPEKEYQYVSYVGITPPFNSLLVTSTNSHLYKKYGLGTTTFSSLAGGLLTGKVKSFFFS